MAGITLAQAESKLAEWMAADTKVSSGQSYDIDGRSLSRADARVIKENIEFWDAKVQKLSRSGGGMKVMGVTPV